MAGPPSFSTDTHIFAQVTGMRDKGIVMVDIASAVESTSITESTLAFLPPRFRNVIYLRRGSYLILSKIPNLSKEDLVQYTIEHPLRTSDIKQYRKDGTWPSTFDRKTTLEEEKIDEDNGNNHFSTNEEEEEEGEEEEVVYY